MGYQDVTLQDIMAARERLQGICRHTPLEPAEYFDQMTGTQVFLKLENLQKTGSFKLRGACNKIAVLGKAAGRGVVAASAGNHAQGVAFAARQASIPATIVMPEGAPITKVERTRSFGAHVVLQGQGYDDAFCRAQEIRQETGAAFVHAFDDPWVIAGQGTVGLELLADLPEVETVLVPVGGGGLISGVACAIKELRPGVQIIGVEAADAPCMLEACRKGKVTELAAAHTIADGIAVRRAGDLTFKMVQHYVDQIVTVTDEEIARAILLLLENAKLVVEGAGAVGIAALLHGKCRTAGKKAAVILSGGNIDVNVVSIIIERGLVKAGRYLRLRTVITDKPGSLQKLLSALAAGGANVISVAHDRIKPSVPLTQAEVELALETRNAAHLQEIVQSLTNMGYALEVLK
ncbi:threonine ammonia-lyase [Desulforamulus hydrothermalis]|uniref:L-threonine dehydratase catabolic TdcB n=1 Tax=Desulforamulus hydrothermalis Lam5 = DSM 18033 TaxID=1121428 RepID=K8DZV5_9FIRM|nr:threonine ammonia-lyase [Desulforamulus hydrothermalis]CCO08605.1 L-threonine ammonia-lyase [Desulforamulus hydrothermalis Lam5 = DSM 18033]SHH01330.1 threonine dehydratase [Desulforamulus hydrothermalis Lam5 = DSM 18033]